METAALVQLLEQLDESKDWYFPDSAADDFNPEMADAQFERFIQQLQQSTGLLVTEEDGSIQDATFYRSVRLPNPSHYFIQPELRFSIFGNLAAVLLAERVEASVLTAIRTLLPLHGYVPAELLNQPYRGVQNNSHIATWWDRYFDYI
ncbi:hypothetical protein [Hymenobacter persicinus]|uniref:Uncharacterized protein n=1 Tax=Hymenobacter persicinus TaxID=2025506 RepID=A0A4Q5LGT1_9BACT|nr:hypothetical protein [Hymenobacter persicinus]RYU82878.1 hypothetical protein EWM57_04085 [Hymenobacter persicinus]